MAFLRFISLRCVVIVGLIVGLAACQGGREAGGDVPRSESQPDQNNSGEQTAPQAPEPAASLLGCDPIDPEYCLFPFPNNHFTKVAPAGSVQAADTGGTGLKLDFKLLAMPRNVLGKPVDPTEWNRNDGFSPGAMIMAYVPGLATDEQGRIPGAVSLTNLSDYLNEDASIIVVDADTGARQPIWAEIDLNAGFFQPSDELGQPIKYLDGRAPKPALIIRPARNFAEGHRYVVILRDLRNDDGELIKASPAFAACRDGQASRKPLANRCAALEAHVFSTLPEDVERESLYLAWDFTVASEKSLSSRLLHIRDDAFASLGESMDILPGEPGYELGDAPEFTIDSIVGEPREGIARRIEGTITVPSYVVPIDPSPLEGMRNALGGVLAPVSNLLKPARDACRDALPLSEPCLIFEPDEAIAFASTLSLPPNRFFYNPLDGEAGLSPWGDGLPDRLTPNASMQRPFICNLPAKASADQPARASIYGHGLLGDRGEVNASHVTSMGGIHNVLFCAVDWFGFSSGDLANVLTLLVDISNFPVLGDSAQQGMLNMMFMARLMVHPDGLASDPAFQDEQGNSLINTDGVYFDGNSQGGIMGGAVVAASRDVNRGVLGVPGMNYSTLLRRSVDFDLYSIPLYVAYPDDLDRNLVLALMEMQWERAENNGYAQHMNTANTPNTPLRGSPDNQLLLHVGFSDHQVTQWSADVMARTLHAALDRSGLDRNPLAAQPNGADRHPDNDEYFLIDNLADPLGLSFEDGRYDGSVLAIWDEPWDASEPETRCQDNHTEPAPIGNVPPRGTGDDSHECPRREPGARCQKSHFMTPNGTVLDVSQIHSDADCPALP